MLVQATMAQVIFSLAGANGIERHDPRHTRSADGCKWALEQEHHYECEGCQRRLGRTSDKHSYEPGKCRLADPDVRGRVITRQQGVHEPRVRASSAPGAGLRDTPRSHDIPEAEDNSSVRTVVSPKSTARVAPCQKVKYERLGGRLQWR